jgi:hypothetical protein
VGGMSMILAMNKDGELEEYKEPYASIDFKTEEDYKRFEDILKYYNKRKEHDRQIRAQTIDDLISKYESAKFADSDENVLSDIHQGVNSGLSMAIHFAKEKKESEM